MEVHLGGWHWIQRATKVKNLVVPSLLVPELKAKKSFEDSLYQFEVALQKRGMGLLVRYAGALEAGV